MPRIGQSSIAYATSEVLAGYAAAPWCVASCVPFAGCGEEQGLPTCVGFADGAPCLNSAGTCFDGNCEVACAEQGLITAVAAGGGPYTFACDGPQTVVTSAAVVIKKPIVLDGRGDLTLDGAGDHRVFRVDKRAVATLSGMTITRGFVEEGNGGAIAVGGTLALEGVTVSGSTASNTGSLVRGHGGGIYNTGTLTLSNSTVSGNVMLRRVTIAWNRAAFAGGLSGTQTVVHTVVAGNLAMLVGDNCLQGSETILGESCTSCFAYEACCSMNQPDCQAAFDACLGSP